MPRLILIVALTLYCLRLSAQEHIQQVDFKNFTYPVSGHLLGHGSLQWLCDSTARTSRKPIQLVDGKDLTKTSSFVIDRKEYVQYEGFTLESVRYADLTGDGKEEAVVDLLYQSSGTQTTNYVYIYTLDQHRPKLLAYCHTGSRSDAGLYGVYVKRDCWYLSCSIQPEVWAIVVRLTCSSHATSGNPAVSSGLVLLNDAPLLYPRKNRSRSSV